MRILVHTRFYPSVGGIETVARILAQECVIQGESVTVVTDVPADPASKIVFPFPVSHRPSPPTWIGLLRTHDVFVHFNISLRALWPLLFVRRPFVAVHHGFYTIDRSGNRDWKETLKLRLTKRANKNIAVSEAIAKAIRIPCRVIPNPYDPTVFKVGAEQARPKDLIFVGRLVSDKGADTLLNALAILRERKLRPQLTIVGDGPERAALETLAAKFALSDQVTFAGLKTQQEIAAIMQQHKIIVVPSLWHEPFGIVALEGIASGCVAIASEAGGLSEAVGPCGITFPNGDATALANRIAELLNDETRMSELLHPANAHLAKHDPSCISAQYLDVIGAVVCRS